VESEEYDDDKTEDEDEFDDSEKIEQKVVKKKKRKRGEFIEKTIIRTTIRRRTKRRRRMSKDPDYSKVKKINKNVKALFPFKVKLNTIKGKLPKKILDRVFKFSKEGLPNVTIDILAVEAEEGITTIFEMKEADLFEIGYGDPYSRNSEDLIPIAAMIHKYNAKEALIELLFLSTDRVLREKSGLKGCGRWFMDMLQKESDDKKMPICLFSDPMPATTGFYNAMGFDPLEKVKVQNIPPKYFFVNKESLYKIMMISMVHENKGTPQEKKTKCPLFIYLPGQNQRKEAERKRKMQRQRNVI